MNAVAVVPAFNEAPTVGDVVRALIAAGFPVIVVDDGSSDDTARLARDAGATVLALPLNLGVGGALRCGFRWAVEAGFDVAVQVDADGQHSPAEIARLLRAMKESGAEMVVGSRFMEESGDYAMSRGRRWSIKLLSSRVHASTGVRVSDASSGFRAIRRPLLTYFADDYPVEYLGDTVEALILAGQRGAKVLEVPTSMEHRTEGTSTASTLASMWYVGRVLVAIELMHRRRSRKRALRDAEPLT